MTETTGGDVRARVLDAAEQILADDPSGFTMDAVATRAGVSRATVYRRFGGVDGLRKALREERGADEVLAKTDVRSRILGAAIAEFLASGVHGSTMQGIADRAGVSVQSVYNHFADKEGLVAALVTKHGPGSAPFDGPGELGSKEEAVRAFVDRVVRIAFEQREVMGVIIAPDAVTRRAFARIRGTNADARVHLERMLRQAGLPEGIDPGIAAVSLMGMIIANAVLRPTLFGDPPPDRDALVEQITALYTKGIEGGEGT